MTIKYECDDCGQLVNEVEAIGPGVVDTTANPKKFGRTYNYHHDASNFMIEVTLTKPGNTQDTTFCYACMWKMFKKMVEERGPKVETIDANRMTHEEWIYSEDWWCPFHTLPSQCKETCPRPMSPNDRIEIADVTGLPDGQFVAQVINDQSKEVINEESDHGTKRADLELPELHAEGVLPEAGADEPADDPGLVTKDGVPVLPGVDPGPTSTAAWAKEQRPKPWPPNPARRGWRHPGQI